MSKHQDRFTGRLIDKPSDSLPNGNGESCDECGTELINRCIGAVHLQGNQARTGGAGATPPFTETEEQE